LVEELVSNTGAIMGSNSDWADFNRKILEGLDIEAVYTSLGSGIETTWAKCGSASGQLPWRRRRLPKK
jgi:hypothetical protein